MTMKRERAAQDEATDVLEGFLIRSFAEVEKIAKDAAGESGEDLWNGGSVDDLELLLAEIVKARDTYRDIELEPFSLSSYEYGDIVTQYSGKAWRRDESGDLVQYGDRELNTLYVLGRIEGLAH